MSQYNKLHNENWYYGFSYTGKVKPLDDLNSEDNLVSDIVEHKSKIELAALIIDLRKREESLKQREENLKKAKEEFLERLRENEEDPSEVIDLLG